MTTGQWLTGADGTRWFFDSGALCLDFSHTGPTDGIAREQLQLPSDLSAWLGDRLDNLDSEASDRDLEDALLLRTSIARAAVAGSLGREIDPDDVDIINLYAATPDIPPALPGGRRQAGARRVRVPQALSTVARDAVAQLAADAGHRIRECSADDCRLVFYDESRASNRRWCSMQRCGNRAKVRTHRAKASNRT